MPLRSALLLVVAVSLPAPAIAQTVAEAFACKLPAVASLGAAQKLTIDAQNMRPEDASSGPQTFVDFKPGDTRLFGQVPTMLSLHLAAPAKAAASRQMKLVLSATFARTPQTNRALLASAEWPSGSEPNETFCMAKWTKGSGHLSYLRNATTLTYRCEFAFDEKDLQQ